MATLAVVSLVTFVLMLDLTVVNVALPDIRKAFDSNFSALQWILDAYALGLAAVLLAAGSLADRIGRKKVYDGGLVLFLVASLVCGLAPDDLTLIVARFVQGLGGAILFAVGPALLGHEFRGKARGTAFGVFGAVAGLAIAFGPLIGGGLTQAVGWRWIFLVNIPIGIVALAIGFAKMRESRDEHAQPVDWAGMAVFSAGLFFLVLAFMRGQQDGWTSARILGAFVFAAVLLAAFAGIQVARGERAMFDLALFRNTTFNGLSVVTALSAGSVMSALFLIISYVQNLLGYSAFAAGLRFLPLTLVLFVAAALTGGLVARVAPAWLLGISQLCIATGLALMLLVRNGSGWGAMVPALIVIGLGMGMFNPPRAAYSIAVTTPDKAGMASGVNETFQQAGLAVGIAAVGALFENRVEHAFLADMRSTLGGGAGDAAKMVAAGGIRAVARSAPESIRVTVADAGRSAFVVGLHDAMLLGAGVAALSAVVAVLTLRRRDLDEAALATPGMPAAEPEESTAGQSH